MWNWRNKVAICNTNVLQDTEILTLWEKQLAQYSETGWAAQSAAGAKQRGTPRGMHGEQEREEVSVFCLFSKLRESRQHGFIWSELGGLPQRKLTADQFFKQHFYHSYLSSITQNLLLFVDFSLWLNITFSVRNKAYFCINVKKVKGIVFCFGEIRIQFLAKSWMIRSISLSCLISPHLMYGKLCIWFLLSLSSHHLIVALSFCTSEETQKQWHR